MRVHRVKILRPYCVGANQGTASFEGKLPCFDTPLSDFDNFVGVDCGCFLEALSRWFCVNYKSGSRFSDSTPEVTTNDAKVIIIRPKVNGCRNMALIV